jgi:hypothetical protein
MIVASSQVLELLDSGVAGFRDMLLFDMPSGFYGFWNDSYDLTYNSYTFFGVPGVFSINDLTSNASPTINQLDVIFSGIDSKVNQHVHDEEYHRRPVTGYKAIIDEKKGVVVDVMDWFTAVIDQVETEELVGGNTSLVVKLDVGGWELKSMSYRTRSDADHQSIVPGDKGYEFTASAVTLPIYWGKAGPVRPDRAIFNSKIGSNGGGG